jgi:hypothetical protein
MDVLAVNEFNEPVILAGEFGRGRLVYFGPDASWHQDPVNFSDFGQARELMRQAMSWVSPLARPIGGAEGVQGILELDVSAFLPYLVEERLDELAEVTLRVPYQDSTLMAGDQVQLSLLADEGDGHVTTADAGGPFSVVAVATMTATTPSSGVFELRGLGGAADAAKLTAAVKAALTAGDSADLSPFGR